MIRHGEPTWTAAVSTAVLVALCAMQPALAAGTAGGAAPDEVVRERASAVGVDLHAPIPAAGRAVAWPLDGGDGSEIGAAGAVVVDAPLETVLARVRDLSLLRERGVLVAAGRVPSGAAESAFDRVVLPESSLDAIAHARPGASDIKLSASEMRALRAASPERRSALFDRLLAARLAAWRDRGVGGLDTYEDKRRPLDQARATTALLSRLSCTRPACGLARSDAFEYWSVERFGSLKPVVALTEMATYEADGLVRVETVQIYATHYFDGLVTAIDLVSVPLGDCGATLVRVSVLARLDMFTGVLGPIKFRAARSRMVDGLAESLDRIRASFASPPATR